VIKPPLNLQCDGPETQHRPGRTAAHATAMNCPVAADPINYAWDRPLKRPWVNRVVHVAAEHFTGAQDSSNAAVLDAIRANAASPLQQPGQPDRYEAAKQVFDPALRIWRSSIPRFFQPEHACPTPTATALPESVYASTGFRRTASMRTSHQYCAPSSQPTHRAATREGAWPQCPPGQWLLKLRPCWTAQPGHQHGPHPAGGSGDGYPQWRR